MMRPSSLAVLDGDLAAQLEHVPEEQLRAAALAAVRFALARTPLTEPAIAAGLAALDQRRYGDAGGVRPELESLVNEYDQRQWTLQDEGRGDAPEYFDAFEKARAANTVYYALDPDPWLAATRAIYDAEAATNDLAGLRQEVQRVLQAS